MNDDAPSLKQLNRTFIGSVLFIDIVGYSLRTVPDQLAIKELFNQLLSDAVQNVAPSDRIMVDTGDGAGIAFLGDPEDALFTALSLRDAIDHGRTAAVGEPGFVRMGINLGPLKIVRDINGHTNMIGDGVNDAQRVMSFAEPGQVMVSHSYLDIISRFSRDYQQLFIYEGTRQDKHVREHEVYRFGAVADNTGLAERLRDRSRVRGESTATEMAASQPAAGDAPPATARKTLPRAGLVAGAVGALTLVGAVWSWTSTAPKPEPQAASVQQASALASAPKSIEEIAEREASKPAAGKSASKTGDTKLAMKAPEASTPSKPASSSSPAPASASAKASETVKPGTVKLAIQPWGEIYVDGSKRGISPPLKSLNLAPGKHRIEVRNSEFAPYKETIEVKSGGEATVQYVF
jgi:class 3 adenylate cyclase